MTRLAEFPRWALMVKPDGTIIRVREEFANEKRELGWTLIARESDVLPGSTNEQSNPRRQRRDGAMEKDDV